MQRIFKCGDIQNTSLTFDKELNVLIYWTPWNISCTLSRMVRIWFTLYFAVVPFTS